VTFDPTNPQDRADMRDFIDDDARGLDYTNLAAALGCEATHEAVMAALGSGVRG
jgi:hypothetical protein